MNGPEACVLWLLQQPKKLGHPPSRFIHPTAAGRTIVSQQLLRPALLHESMWQVTSRSFVNDANAACGKVSFKGAVAAGLNGPKCSKFQVCVQGYLPMPSPFVLEVMFSQVPAIMQRCLSQILLSGGVCQGETVD